MQTILRTLCTLIVFLCALATEAQVTTGTIQGTVTDPTGAVIPSAIVTLSNQAGVAQSATGNGNGAYVFSGVEPGHYHLSAIVDGFAPFDLEDVVVVAGKTTSANIALKMPVETQQVEVTEQGEGQDLEDRIERHQDGGRLPVPAGEVVPDKDHGDAAGQAHEDEAGAVSGLVGQ